MRPPDPPARPCSAACRCRRSVSSARRLCVAARSSRTFSALGWMGFSRNQNAPRSCMVWMAVSILPKAVSTMDGGSAALRIEALQQLEAVHARHHQIGDQNVHRRAWLSFVQRFLAVGCRFHRIAPGLDHLGKAERAGSPHRRQRGRGSEARRRCCSLVQLYPIGIYYTAAKTRKLSGWQARRISRLRVGRAAPSRPSGGPRPYLVCRSVDPGRRHKSIARPTGMPVSDTGQGTSGQNTGTGLILLTPEERICV